MKTAVLLVFILTGLAALRGAEGDSQKPFDLTTLSGESYQNCRIVRTTPEGITILHDRGTTRIAFEKLNDDWKKRFDYSPEKARAYQKVEAARIAQAEEKQRQLRIENENQRTMKQSTAATAQNQRLQNLLASLAQQQADTISTVGMAAVTQPGLMIAPPCDLTPYLVAGVLPSKVSTVGNVAATTPSTTEVFIPETTPVTQIFTPGSTGGQRYIINQGAVFTPGDGSMYYINPGYMNPGYGTPIYINPPPIIICPPQHVRPPHPVMPRPTTRSGSSTIRIGP